MTPRNVQRLRPFGRRTGFTLTELMIAVAVLIGVLLATSKIFSTTSKVTAAGKATADILQEIPAIERQLRRDFSRLSRDGVMAIRNVAIENFNESTGQLLNPNLPLDAKLRCDQIVFFVDGLESSQVFKVGDFVGANHKGQGTASRVYYGHVFQLGEAGGPIEIQGGSIVAHDTDPSKPVYPWTSGQVHMQKTRFSGNNIFRASDPFPIDVPAMDARRWGLARQAVLMVDDDTGPIDDDGKTDYLGQILTGRSLFLQDPRLGFTPQILHGRVDAAAMDFNELRQLVMYTPTYTPRPWSNPNQNLAGQFSFISGQLLYYPRAERTAPSMHRVDQALTSQMLLSACSSIKIDWTYAPRTGELLDAYGDVVVETGGNAMNGFYFDPDSPQPWFGLEDEDRDVWPYGVDDNDQHTWTGAVAVYPETVERYPIDGWGDQVEVYEAVFGYNQTEPLDADGYINPDLGFTPWPSAIRITLTIHDPATTLEGGREVEFIIRLPDRGGLPSR